MDSSSTKGNVVFLRFFFIERERERNGDIFWIIHLLKEYLSLVATGVDASDTLRHGKLLIISLDEREREPMKISSFNDHFARWMNEP